MNFEYLYFLSPIELVDYEKVIDLKQTLFSLCIREICFKLAYYKLLTVWYFLNRSTHKQWALWFDCKEFILYWTQVSLFVGIPVWSII